MTEKTDNVCGECWKFMKPQCPTGCIEVDHDACNMFDSFPHAGETEPKRSITDVETASAFHTQVGGSHYKNYKIQPFVFFHVNQIPFPVADIIKRLMRYNKPGGKGLQDLEKCKHELDMIIELEGFTE